MFYPFSASLGVYNFSQLPIDFLFTDYSLIIRDPEEQKSGYSTAGSVSESVGAVAGQEILAGTNQDEGGMIPLETEVSGKVSDGRGQWYAFTTNSVENATYEVTTVNKTPGTGDFCLRVYNMYGETMHWYSLNANQRDRKSVV